MMPALSSTMAKRAPEAGPRVCASRAAAGPGVAELAEQPVPCEGERGGDHQRGGAQDHHEAPITVSARS